MRKRKYYAFEWELLFAETKSGRRFAKYYSFQSRNSRDAWVDSSAMRASLLSWDADLKYEIRAGRVIETK